MAKVSAVNKNEKRIKLSNSLFKKRQALKKIVMDKKISLEERFKAQQKLSNLPRIKDFRGLSPKGFDKFGNYTFGIKEHIIFPEVNFDRIDKIRGLDVVVVISAMNKDHSLALLEKLNFPIIKKGDN